MRSLKNTVLEPLGETFAEHRSIEKRLEAEPEVERKRTAAVGVRAGSTVEVKQDPCCSSFVRERKTLKHSSQKILHTYIFAFRFFARKMTSQLLDFFLGGGRGGINFPNITYHVFVCDSENYTEKIVWELFSWKISRQIHEIMF